jgi:hypothetical protein
MTDDQKKWLMIGGAGLLALLLFRKKANASEISRQSNNDVGGGGVGDVIGGVDDVIGGDVGGSNIVDNPVIGGADGAPDADSDSEATPVNAVVVRVGGHPRIPGNWDDGTDAEVYQNALNWFFNSIYIAEEDLTGISLPTPTLIIDNDFGPRSYRAYKLYYLTCLVAGTLVFYGYGADATRLVESGTVPKFIMSPIMFSQSAMDQRDTRTLNSTTTGRLDIAALRHLAASVSYDNSALTYADLYYLGLAFDIIITEGIDSPSFDIGEGITLLNPFYGNSAAA